MMNSAVIKCYNRFYINNAFSFTKDLGYSNIGNFHIQKYLYHPMNNFFLSFKHRATLGPNPFYSGNYFEELDKKKISTNPFVNGYRLNAD